MHRRANHTPPTLAASPSAVAIGNGRDRKPTLERRHQLRGRQRHFPRFERTTLTVDACRQPVERYCLGVHVYLYHTCSLFAAVVVGEQLCRDEFLLRLIVIVGTVREGTKGQVQKNSHRSDHDLHHLDHILWILQPQIMYAPIRTQNTRQYLTNPGSAATFYPISILYVSGGGINCVSCDVCVYHVWFVFSLGYSSAPDSDWSLPIL